MPVIFFRRCTGAALFLLLVIAGGRLASPASAQGSVPDRSITVHQLTQEDLNNDGNPDVTVISAAFITGSDRVTVYDRGGDMQTASTWELATDFHNDLWVFDAGADGRVELIIDFRETEEGLAAYLWDDQDGDGTVHYSLTPRVEVTESQTPTIQVFAPDGWWTRDGKTNFNLDLRVDGKIQASFTAKHWLEYVSTDGIQDYYIEVRDTDRDGRPDYQWVNAWPEASRGKGIRRTEIVVSPQDDEPPVEGSIFWPFLGSTLDWDNLRLDRTSNLPGETFQIAQPRSGYNKSYGVSMPPIQMLWDKGVLLYVGEFVASRFNDDNWFVYSIRRVTPGQASPVTFEAPFAFYDLAEDNDSYPELLVRFEQYLARDPYPFRERNRDPIQIIRYTWDQDNDTTWKYKLGLIGRHTITDTVTVGNLELQMPDPATLPQWVMERSWDGATFVVAETEENWTSEGIYEWDIHGRWRDRYVTGLGGLRPLVEELSELAEGQRGELTFDLHRQPMLYFSPVDRKLHLLQAEEGQWQIDEQRQIQYKNLGGDYINSWTLLENGTPTKRLFFVMDYLIYEDENGVQWIQTEQAPVLFTASPPTSSTELEQLTQELQKHSREIPPWDFEAMLAQFGTPAVLVEEARIEDFRLTSRGFRFILRDGSSIESRGMTWAANRPLTADDTLVTYDGEIKIQPLSDFDLSLKTQLSNSEEFVVGVPTSILVDIRNAGLSDAISILLVVQAQKDDAIVEIARQRLNSFTETPTQVGLTWIPADPGDWNIQARLAIPDEMVIAESIPHAVQVRDASAGPQQVLLLSLGGNMQLLALLLILLAYFSIAALLARSVLQPKP